MFIWRYMTILIFVTLLQHCWLEQKRLTKMMEKWLHIFIFLNRVFLSYFFWVIYYYLMQLNHMSSAQDGTKDLMPNVFHFISRVQLLDFTTMQKVLLHLKRGWWNTIIHNLYSILIHILVLWSGERHNNAQKQI